MIERYLKSVRKNFKYDVDNDIIELLPFIHEKNVEIVVINSSSARNEIVKTEDGKWTVIWDTFYWEHFKRVITLLMSAYASESSKVERELLLDYFEASLYEFLSLKYKCSHPNISLCFAKQGLKNKRKCLEIDFSNTEWCDSLVKMSKINLLSHELGHIVLDKDFQLETEIASTVKEYLGYLNQIGALYEGRSDAPEAKKVLDSIPDFIEGKNKNYLSEIVDDVLSYIEGLDFVTKQLQLKELITMYTYGALLLRNFNWFINSAEGVIKGCLKFQGKEIDITDPVIEKTNYINFFRYTIYSPLILAFLIKSVQTKGISYDEFKNITEPIEKFQFFYDQYISGRLDNIVRLEMPHVIKSVLKRKNLEECIHVDRVIEFLLEN